MNGSGRPGAQPGTVCWRCGTPAAVIVTELHYGTRAYCSTHFLALGSLPSGSACCPAAGARRCA